MSHLVSRAGASGVGDPREGIDARGMIATGARRDRVPPPFETVVEAIAEAVTAADIDAAVYLYGSVATGQARPGSSDVDVLTIGLAPEVAAEIGRDLDARFDDLCRGVELGAASASDLRGDHDEAYGFRVFLRHYCVHLAGPDVRPAHDFPADERAARGFNGDIAEHLARWRTTLDTTDHADMPATRVARKTLLAVAGLVSVQYGTWTTDRRRAVEPWSLVHPELAAGLDRLLGWTGGSDPRHESRGSCGPRPDRATHRGRVRRPHRALERLTPDAVAWSGLTARSVSSPRGSRCPPSGR